MGGIEKIILTMTLEFAKTREVIVISEPESTVLRILNSSKARYKWIRPDKREIDNNIGSNDLLIIFYGFKELKLTKSANPYIFIWNVYPPFGKRNFLKWLSDSIKIRELYWKHSLMTMDPYCNSVFKKKYGFSLGSTYLKIPIESNANKYYYRLQKDNINLTYIGRGNDIWKIKPIKKLVKDLCANGLTNIRIHIFTDTTSLFEQELAHVNSHDLKILFHLGYTGKSLSDKLFEISDIHYSMGTSMLEGASLGIPTLIADASMDDFPESYKYRWFIDDVENYAGIFIDSKSEFTGYSISDLVNQFLDETLMRDISLRQHKYIAENYSPAKVSDTIFKLNPRANVKTLVKYSPSLWF